MATTKKKTTTKKKAASKKAASKKAAPEKENPIKQKPSYDGVVFTQSRMASFLECERKEWFQYQAGGAGIEPAIPQDYYIEGSLGHYALYHWYKNWERGGIMFRKLMVDQINKQIEEMGPIDPAVDDKLRTKLSAMIGACHGYKVVHKSDFDKYEVLATEQVFEVEFAGVLWKGKVDLALRDKKEGTIGYFEHKFLQQFSLNDYLTLPLNLQALLYVVGFKSLFGKYPDWYQWNIIKKSQLRRKGLKPAKGQMAANPEPWDLYETRVQEQYVNEPDKMFMRPPPRIVEAKPLEVLESNLTTHVESWKRVKDKGEIPPCRWPSCVGKFGTGCKFAAACTAQMQGKGEGWDASECSGLYRPKESVHPELEPVEELSPTAKKQLAKEDQQRKDKKANVKK